MHYFIGERIMVATKSNNPSHVAIRSFIIV